MFKESSQKILQFIATPNGFESFFLVLPPDSLKNSKEAIYFVDNPAKDLLPPIS